MRNPVEAHYGVADLARRIARAFRDAGRDIGTLTTADLAPVDEFHSRGRAATLELASRMELGPESHVLDIGSGLGGPARTLVERYGCRVTGIDLSPEFCETARELSRWVGLSDSVTFHQGDATALPWDAPMFDSVMTIHVAMNIPAKDAVYRGVHRVLRPGGIFVVYDILQGEGGDVLYPAPWARDPSISHLATPAQMRALLQDAGFEILDEQDSSTRSEAWFGEVATRLAAGNLPPVSLRLLLGDDFVPMMRNQLRNLAEHRIGTVMFVCRHRDGAA
jgi:ubiquinone/menaquinone biosynthesis C-methylase UbiE